MSNQNVTLCLIIWMWKLAACKIGQRICISSSWMSTTQVLLMQWYKFSFPKLWFAAHKLYALASMVGTHSRLEKYHFTTGRRITWPTDHSINWNAEGSGDAFLPKPDLCNLFILQTLMQHVTFNSRFHSMWNYVTQWLLVLLLVTICCNSYSRPSNFKWSINWSVLISEDCSLLLGLCSMAEWMHQISS